MAIAAISNVNFRGCTLPETNPASFCRCMLQFANLFKDWKTSVWAVFQQNSDASIHNTHMMDHDLTNNLDFQKVGKRHAVGWFSYYIMHIAVYITCISGKSIHKYTVTNWVFFLDKSCLALILLATLIQKNTFRQHFSKSTSCLVHSAWAPIGIEYIVEFCQICHVWTGDDWSFLRPMNCDSDWTIFGCLMFIRNPFVLLKMTCLTDFKKSLYKTRLVARFSLMVSTIP